MSKENAVEGVMLVLGSEIHSVLEEDIMLRQLATQLVEQAVRSLEETEMEDENTLEELYDDMDTFIQE